MLPILDHTPEELVSALSLKQAFRGRQIFRDLHKNLKTFDEITTISPKMKEELNKISTVYSSSIENIQTSKDGTVKLSFKLHDQNRIEAVLLQDKEKRLTACLSTQVGCAMGCEFCKTATMGLIRNLESYEIIEQFYHLRKRYGDISNIVFMGMGEPLHNFDALKKAVNILGHEGGLNFSPRRITVSTCGLGEGIYRLADEIPQVRLAVSLNTAIEPKRLQLMPVTKATPLSALKEALVYHQTTTGKRFTLEYVLLPGENDTDHDIQAIRRFSRNLHCMVNLIPWNSAPGLKFNEATIRKITEFKHKLEKQGIKVVLRQKKGEDIDGACGQLASESRIDD